MITLININPNNPISSVNTINPNEIWEMKISKIK